MVAGLPLAVRVVRPARSAVLAAPGGCRLGFLSMSSGGSSLGTYQGCLCLVVADDAAVMIAGLRLLSRISGLDLCCVGTIC